MKAALSLAALLFVISIFEYGSNPFSTSPPAKKIEGDYTLMEYRPSTHEAGKVKMTVFLDFRCTACYDLYKLVPQIEAKYGSKLEVSSIEYPLTDLSYKPIEAYELAKDEGKGKEMQDALFNAYYVEKSNISDVRILLSIASGVGLNTTQFNERLNSSVKKGVVDKNRAVGLSYGIRRLPAVVFDGQILAADTSNENLEKIIDSILEPQ